MEIIEENKIRSVHALQKKALITYLLIMSVNLLTYLYISWSFVSMSPFSFFYGFLLAGHIGFIWPAYKMSYAKIRIIFPAFMLLSFIALCPIIILSHVMGNLVLYIWATVIPTCFLTFYPNMRKSIRLTFYGCYVVLFSVLAVGGELFIDFFSDELMSVYLKLAKKDAPLQNKLSYVQPIILGTFTQCYMLHYYQQILRATVRLDCNCNNSPETDEQDDASMIAKYNELYGEIIKFFESDKPYLDSKFNISQLSVQLNTNTAYVARAIKQNRDMNFKSFIGLYRIEHAKELIRANRGLYTLEHIYMSSGFTNQSTFNQLFRKIEGITPGDFQKEVLKQEE